MATEISSPVFTSATASHLVAFHQAVEPRRSTPTPVLPLQEEGAPALSSKEIDHAVGQMNQLAHVLNRRLSFSMDYETNDVIVKVVNAETDEVIKELPPAELQKLHRSIKEAVGLLIDKLI